VESPGLDTIRLAGAVKDGMSSLFAQVNRGKQSVRLDPRKAEDMAVVKQMVAEADVLLQNFRPGVMERMGLGYEVCRALNSRLLYVSISGYGTKGVDADIPAYDTTIQVQTGWSSMTENPEVLISVVADKVTSFTAAQAISAALFARERSPTHAGQHIELSMLHANLAFNWPDLCANVAVLDEKVPQPKMPRRPNYLWKTKDGYVAMLALSDKEFRNLCTVLDAEKELLPRFATLPQRITQLETLVGELIPRIEKFSTSEFVKRARANNVPAATHVPFEQLPQLQQAKDLDIFEVVQHPQLGPLRHVKPAVHFSNTPSCANANMRHAPVLGQHDPKDILNRWRTSKL